MSSTVNDPDLSNHRMRCASIAKFRFAGVLPTSCALLLGACSPGMIPVDPRATAGITVPDSVPPLRLEIEQVYDGLFVGAREIAVDSIGVLFVADVTTGVFAFTPDGRGRSIGRAGEGPGEFTKPHAVALRADTLYVADALGRLSKLVNNMFVASEPFPALGGAGFIRVMPDGVITRRSRYSPDRTETIGLVRPRSDIMAEILELAHPKVLEYQGFETPKVGAAIPHYFVTSNGTIYSVGPGFTITITSRFGQTLAVASASIPRVRVAATEVDAAYRSRVTGSSIAGRDPPTRRAFRPRKERYVAPLGPIVASDAGAMLVQRSDVRQPDGGTTWDYINADWQVVGRIAVARKTFFSPLVLRGCLLYVKEMDDSLVTTIVRYRLDPCPGS